MLESMANLRDFPLNSAFVWVGNVLTTVSSFMLPQCLVFDVASPQKNERLVTFLDAKHLSQ